MSSSLAKRNLLSVGIHGHGLIAIGVSAHGIVAIGIAAHGIVAIGLVPMGAVSIGFVSMGLIGAGFVSMGLLTVAPMGMGLLQFPRSGTHQMHQDMEMPVEMEPQSRQLPSPQRYEVVESAPHSEPTSSHTPTMSAGVAVLGLLLLLWSWRRLQQTARS